MAWAQYLLAAMLCPGNYIHLERQGKTYVRLLYICYQTSDINGCLPALHHVTVTTLVSMECKRKQCQSDKVVPSHSSRCGFYTWNATPCSCKKTLNRNKILRLHILCHFRATLGCYAAQLNRWWVIKSTVIHTHVHRDVIQHCTRVCDQVALAVKPSLNPWPMHCIIKHNLCC